MEKKNLITALTPEGDVVNKLGAYMQSHGSFNIHKITSKYAEALENNNARELAEVEKEVVRQVLENFKTYAIWEKWGE